MKLSDIWRRYPVKATSILLSISILATPSCLIIGVGGVHSLVLMFDNRYIVLLMRPVTAGGMTEMPLECLGKGESIPVSYGEGDFLYALLRFRQHLHGNLHAIDQKILLQGIAGRFLKKPGKVTAVQSAGKGDRLDLDRFGIFQMDVADHVLNIEKGRIDIGFFFVDRVFHHIVKDFVETSDAIVFPVIVL